MTALRKALLPLVFGVVMVGAGNLLAPLSTTPWQFYLTLGLMYAEKFSRVVETSRRGCRTEETPCSSGPTPI